MCGLCSVRAMFCGVVVLLHCSSTLAQTVGGGGMVNRASATFEEVSRAKPGISDGIGVVLDKYYDHPPNTRDDSPWKLLHWSIAYGIDAQVRMGGPTGKQVSAVGWLCENRSSAGIRLASLTGNGLELPISAGKQGHPGQFLAMLAQARIKPDFGIRVGNRQFTIADLVEHEKDTCRSGTELTFKLIGIAQYSNSEDAWENSEGEAWSLRRLLEEELRQPINSRVTCGGTHRLFALSYAIHCRRNEGRPVDGPWERAQRRINKYQVRAFQLQNYDGSFSTAWFDGKDRSTNTSRRLVTSGHVMEWLAYSLPEERLQDERFENGLRFVTHLLETNQASSSDWGATTHALHALAIYEQRVLGPHPGQRRRQWLEQTSIEK